MCPQTFDYLIRQDVLAKRYYSDGMKLAAEVSVLEFKFEQSDSLQKSTSGLLNVANQEKTMIQGQLSLSEKECKRLRRQNRFLRFGCAGIGVAGIATTIWVAVKK